MTYSTQAAAEAGDPHAAAPASRTVRNGSRNLILLRAGDASLHGTWLGRSPGDRQWDMHISYFGSKANPSPFDEGMSASHDHQKNKWPGIAAALNSGQFSLDDYDYVALPDDDLISTVKDWNRAFQLAREYNLSACQLSLDHASFVGYLETAHRPFLKLRFMSWVEFMAPIVRVDLLKQLIPYLTVDNNVWAVDLVAQDLVGHEPRAMAVLDAARVLHTRAFRTGPLYDHLHEAGVTPEQALEAFLEQHGMTPKPRITYSAVTSAGREIKRPPFEKSSLLYYRFLNWYRTGKGHIRLATAENGEVIVLRKFRFAPALLVDYGRVARFRPNFKANWTPQSLIRALRRINVIGRTFVH